MRDSRRLRDRGAVVEMGKTRRDGHDRTRLASSRSGLPRSLVYRLLQGDDRFRRVDDTVVSK